MGGQYPKYSLYYQSLLGDHDYMLCQEKATACVQLYQDGSPGPRAYRNGGRKILLVRFIAAFLQLVRSVTEWLNSIWRYRFDWRHDKHGSLERIHGPTLRRSLG